MTCCGIPYAPFQDTQFLMGENLATEPNSTGTLRHWTSDTGQLRVMDAPSKLHSVVRPS